MDCNCGMIHPGPCDGPEATELRRARNSSKLSLSGLERAESACPFRDEAMKAAFISGWLAARGDQK